VDAEDLSCGRDFDLRSRGCVVLPHREPVDFADQLYSLADEGRFEIAALVELFTSPRSSDPIA
jgi:hypothetical protein